MSGPNKQSPQAVTKLPTTNASSEDHAASLRAAALLTLKSKKRKAPVSSSEHNIPPRSLAAPPSIQLDYGSEEPSGGASSIASSPAMLPVASAAPVPEPLDVDDGDAREEGEISDSEMSPPSPKSKPERIATKLTQPDQRMLPPSLPSVEPVFLGSSSTSPPPPLAGPASQPPPLVDESHVRPGLAMTEAQYLTCRDIILDLLGWGVPPEYLVSCGLSREIIFYVFVECNLRLPSNLDVTGLTSLIPPSYPTSDMHVKSPMAEPMSALSATASPFVPGPSPILSPASLHDIEQQRKQELLARKAVQASRKLKQKSNSLAELPPANPRVAPMLSTRGNSSSSIVVPTKTVDDFLNSIGPARPANTPSKSVSRAPRRSFSTDAMDVDEIPGLNGGYGTILTYTPTPRPLSTPHSPPASSTTSPKSPVAPQSTVSTVSTLSFDVPPTSKTANGSLPYEGNEYGTDVIPGLYKTRSPSEESQSTGARRGTKRPVAADFVDMDSAPRTESRGPEHIRGLPRRRITGFAGLPQRRCVIELSDSEDDDGALLSSHVHLKADVRGTQANTPQLSTVPTPRASSPATPSLTAPAALLEKEEQIRRMRELIAQREQIRLRKLAVMTRTTPPSADVRQNGHADVKQEEDDCTVVRSLQSSRSNSSVTPDPSTGLTTVAPLERDGSTATSHSDYDSSDSGTPIEVMSTTLSHSTAGDKVLTGEAQQEQVVAISVEHDEQSHAMEVDVIGTDPETSAQVADAITSTNDQPAKEEHAPSFQTYRSLLDCHPLLRAHSRQDSSPYALSSSSVANGASSTPLVLDLDIKPLKQTAVMKYLSDNSRQVCQYELPGGGECRDKNCDNVHLSRLSQVEPSDEDTAQYLCYSIPGGQRFGIEVFRKALDVVRLSHPDAPFDTRVQQALTRLGLR